jgi:short-subunit dehydrogenase
VNALSGTSALITGASSGIGACFARQLSDRGVSKLVLVARRRDRLEALAAQIGHVAEVHVADLTEPDAVDGLLQAYGDIDVLVNNAGFGWGTPLVEQEWNRLGQMIDLNCRALTALTHGMVPGMVNRGRGWILNVGSTAGVVPMPNMAVYSATKAFVNHFTEALRIELQGTGVRVHLLTPGPVDTEFFAVARPERDPTAERPLGFLFADAQTVAREALDALVADRPRSTPGRPIRWIYGLAATLPLGVIRPLVSLSSSGLDRLIKK